MKEDESNAGVFIMIFISLMIFLMFIYALSRNIKNKNVRQKQQIEQKDNEQGSGIYIKPNGDISLIPEPLGLELP